MRDIRQAEAPRATGPSPMEPATGSRLCARITTQAQGGDAPPTEALARLAIRLCAARNGWCGACDCDCGLRDAAARDRPGRA